VFTFDAEESSDGLIILELQRGPSPHDHLSATHPTS
jgi:hypothetical protein